MGKPRTAEWWPRSDRGQAGRSNFFKLSLQLGARWLFCRLLTGGLTLSAAKLRTWENISLPTLAPTLKRSFSWSGKRRLAFFFFARTTIVASLDWQQDVQCSKVRLLAERSWTDDIQGPWALASPSNVRGLLAGRPHNLPQVRFLSLQVFVTPVLYECHNKAGVGTNVDIRSSNSFLVQRICLHSDTHRQSHWKLKGATTTLPIPSPSHPCSRQRVRRSKLRKARRTKHPNKESISI